MTSSANNLIAFVVHAYVSFAVPSTLHPDISQVVRSNSLNALSVGNSRKTKLLPATISNYLDDAIHIPKSMFVSDLSLPLRVSGLAELSEKIESYLFLDKNWAGEDSCVPSQHVIENVRKIIKNLPESVELPQPSLSADGEVSLSWFNKSNRLEAIVRPDDHLIWVTRIDGVYIAGEDIDISKSINSTSLNRSVLELYA